MSLFSINNLNCFKCYAPDSLGVSSYFTFTLYKCCLLTVILMMQHFSLFVSDKVGRKPVILFASLVFTAGSVVMGLANNQEILLVGRIIVGVGIGKFLFLFMKSCKQPTLTIFIPGFWRISPEFCIYHVWPTANFTFQVNSGDKNLKHRTPTWKSK